MTGALTGGRFMPVVFPVSMANCDGTGDTIVVDESWRMSNPHPESARSSVGQEYIVPLCKTGGGSFMILDLDPNKDCEEEVLNPSSIQFANSRWTSRSTTATTVPRRSRTAIRREGTCRASVVHDPDLRRRVLRRTGGTNGKYHIIRIASFYLDYISYSNSPNNSACELATSPNIRHADRQHRRRQRQLELHGRVVRALRDSRAGRLRVDQQRRSDRGPAHQVTPLGDEKRRDRRRGAYVRRGEAVNFRF